MQAFVKKLRDFLSKKLKAIPKQFLGFDKTQKYI